jgi:hypothetical protein
MAAVYVSNLVVNTGTTFTQTFSLENSDSSSILNLSGYTVSAQMRKHAGSSSYTTFSSAVLNSTAGTIRVGLGTTTTASLKPGRYVYDVLITDNAGVITRVVEGSVLVREGVTR